MTEAPAIMTRARERQFAAACAGMFMFGVVLALLGALFGLPQFRGRLGLDVVQQGTVLSLVYAGVLLATPLAGPFIDRFGNKPLMLGSAALVTVALAGFIAARSFAAAALAGVVLGTGGGGLNIATNALVSDIYGEERGRMMNYLGMFYGIGALFLPLLVATIATRFSTAQIVGCAVALAAACTLAYAAMEFPPPREAHGFTASDALRIAAQPGVILFALLLFFQSGDESVITGWTSTYAGTLGASPAVATWLLTAYLTGVMLGRLAAGYVLAHVTKWQLVFGSACASLAAYGIFLAINNRAVLWIAAAVLGFCLAAIYPTTLALVGDAHRRFAATVLSVVFTIAWFGGILGPWAVGVIAGRFGLRAGMALPLVGRVAVIVLALGIRQAQSAKLKVQGDPA
jgi:MFS transporter, FHS family, glucose/mannose:H+ symporter